MDRSIPNTIPASQLHEVTTAETLALVDALLDKPGDQKSALLRYRFEAEFQQDWKAEIGHVFHTAERFGFDAPLWDRLYSRLHGGGDEPVDIDPNDTRHQMLLADLAPGIVAHCLLGTGWTFDAWEPKRPPEHGRKLDVDLGLIAPDGTPVDVQVKAPDLPGRRAGRRRVDGECDEAVIAAMNKGATQLPRDGSQAKMLVVCAQRDWPLTWTPGAVVSHVIGGATQYPQEPGRGFELLREKWGVFHSAWRHVSAVMLLDLVRGETSVVYGAVVLINPWGLVPANPDWFASGRVCTVVDGVVHWRGGAPKYGGLPEAILVSQAARPGTGEVRRWPS